MFNPPFFLSKDDLVKRYQNDGFVKSSRCQAGKK